MYIVYRDELWTIRIDGIDTVSFLDGIVYFSSGMDDFEIYADMVIEIGKGE